MTPNLTLLNSEKIYRLNEKSTKTRPILIFNHSEFNSKGFHAIINAPKNIPIIPIGVMKYRSLLICMKKTS
jgi:hypothetical protein